MNISITIKEYLAISAAKDAVNEDLDGCEDEKTAQYLKYIIYHLSKILDKYEKAKIENELLSVSRKIVREDYPGISKGKVDKIARGLIRKMKKENQNVHI